MSPVDIVVGQQVVGGVATVGDVVIALMFLAAAVLVMRRMEVARGAKLPQ